MGILLNRAITFAQATARKAGITLIKNSRYAQEWDISAALLTEATDAERTRRGLNKTAKNKPLASGIIFSFNRPVQLHLLLASYFLHVKNPAPLVVQYGAKGDDFELAYKDVAKLFPQVAFIREDGFKNTLLGILNGIATPSLFFLVDDIVFTRTTDMAAFARLDPLKYIPCLRLAPTLSYCYTCQMPQRPPQMQPFDKELLTFNWGEEANEWSYPMSVDGNLFDTAEITVLSRILTYKAPNTYEGALMRMAPVFFGRPGICFAQPRLMNIPCNKVQSEVANKAGDVSPEYLLAQWRDGYSIDPRPLAAYPNRGPHEEVPFSFVQRPKAMKLPTKLQ